MIERLNLARLDRILAGLVLARWLQVILLIFSVPPLWSHTGWYFHHGGDQDYYFEFAQTLLAQQFKKLFAVQVGFPSILSMGIRLTGAQTFEQLLPYVVILFGFILAGASVFLVGRLLNVLLRDDRWAAIGAAIWAFAPWWLWLILGLHPSEAQMRGPYVPMVAWLQSIPDGVTTFVILLCMYYCARVLRTNSRWRGWGWAVPLALAAGCIPLLRIQQVPVLCLLLLVLLLERRWVASILLLAGIVLLYQVQMFYMYRFAVANEGTRWVLTWLPPNFYFGTVVPTTNEIVWAYFPISLSTLPSAIAGNLLRLAPLLLLGLLAVFPLLLWFRQSVRTLGLGSSILLFGMPIAAIGVLLISPIFLESIYRYSLPAMPFLIIFMVAFLQFAQQTLRDRWHKPNTTQTLGDDSGVGSAAA